MKKHVICKWKKFISYILVGAMLCTSMGFDVRAKEVSDVNSEIVSGTEDGEDVYGSYSIEYLGEYLKKPQYRTDISLNETITLPDASDYAERPGYELSYLVLRSKHYHYWYDFHTLGSQIIGKDFTFDGDIVTVEPYYFTNSYEITYVLEPVTDRGNPILDRVNPAKNGDNPHHYTVESDFSFNAPTKTGYVFDGWYLDYRYTQRIEKIESGSIGKLKVYAKWRDPIYTVKFDGNGGIPDIESKTVSYNEEFELPGATSNQEGYRIFDWTLQGTDQVYRVGDKLSQLSNVEQDTVTFVANYSNTFGNVSYVLEPLDENKNEIHDTTNPAKNDDRNIDRYVYGDSFVFLDPVKTGFTFEGWYLDSNYIQKITEIKDTDTGDITLYAKWHENCYTLKLHVNDGTEKVEEISLKYTDTFVLPYRDRDGYQFGYWNTNKKSTEGKLYYASQKISRLSDIDESEVNFYVIWRKISTNPSHAYLNRRSCSSDKYGKVIYSHLISNDDGTFTRVEAYDETVSVENYSSDGNFINGFKVPMELEYWGGFYAGNKYNYMVFGRYNPNEDDELEVVRVVRYTKEWNRVDSLAIKKVNTWLPFDAGSLAMTEMDDILVIHTCKLVYAMSDGLHHQGNMSFFIKISDDGMEYMNSKKYHPWGLSDDSFSEPSFCSHSFNQKATNDGESIITVDHGDGTPRALKIMRYKEGNIDNREEIEFYKIPGESGYNYTGVSLGSIIASTTGYLISANSVDFSADKYSFWGQRNIFVSYIPKDNFNEDHVETKWITNYTKDIAVSIPSVLKINDEKYIVIWEENNEVVRYVYLDAQGNKTSEIASLKNVHFSAGEPIVVDEKVVWYYLNNDEKIVFVSIGENHVSFDSVGGTEISEIFTVLPGEKYGTALKRTYGDEAVFKEPTKIGYKFLGWYTQKEGGQKVTEDSIFSGAFDKVLYAHWESNKYTVSFETDCEETVPSMTVSYGLPFGKLPNVERFGYELMGWYTARDGGEKIMEDSLFEIERDIILYARYRQVHYLTFDANDGYFVDENKIVTGNAYVLNVGLDEIPYAVNNIYRKNYEFLGWYTAKTGGEEYDFSKILTDHITVYAHYEPVYVIADVKSTYETGSKFEKPSYVQLSCATANTSVYYYFDEKNEIDADIFTADCLIANGFVYEDAFLIPASGTLYATATLPDYNKGKVYSFTYYVQGAENYWGDVAEGDRAAFEDATKVPQGLWIAGAEDRIYDGTAQKQDIRVYYGLHRLTEKTNYTISYKNNVKAGTAKLIIAGKGCYSGKAEQTFTILPADISGAKIENVWLTENGKVQKAAPAVSIFLNGKTVKLKKGTDFEFIYDPGDYVASGEYFVTVRGKGNFEGSQTTFKQTIVASTLSTMKKVSVGKLPAREYTGEPITFTKDELVVKIGSEVLKEKVDYTVQYSDNTEIGTASILIKGTGTKCVGEKMVSFKITGIPMSKVTVGNLEKSFPYSGKEQRQYKATLTYRYKNALKETVEVPLKADEDYEVSYIKNVNVGTATVVFTGKGKYVGTLKKTFKITPYDLKSDAENGAKVVVKIADNYEYVKGGIMAKPEIHYSHDGEDVILEEGKDYTLSYKNLDKVTYSGLEDSKGPNVTVKGKGNYAGLLDGGKAFCYNVSKKSLGNLSMEIGDIVYKEKAGICKPIIAIYDSNGKKLSVGVDYNKEVSYRYEEETIVGQMIDGQKKYVIKEANSPVEKEDIIPAGTQIRAIVSAVNKEATHYYGSIEGVFRYVESDISKCKITLNHGFTYHPSDLQFVKSDFVVLNGKVLVESKYYSVDSVTISEKDKCAIVTVVGTGKFGGKKVVKVKLSSLNFNQ